MVTVMNTDMISQEKDLKVFLFFFKMPPGIPAFRVDKDKEKSKLSVENSRVFTVARDIKGF